MAKEEPANVQQDKLNRNAGKDALAAAEAVFGKESPVLGVLDQMSPPPNVGVAGISGQQEMARSFNPDAFLSSGQNPDYIDFTPAEEEKMLLLVAQHRSLKDVADAMNQTKTRVLNNMRRVGHERNEYNELRKILR